MNRLAVLALITIQALPSFAQNLADNAAVRAKILNEAKALPVYYTVTEQAMLGLDAITASKMISFVHPLSEKAETEAGLRFIPVSRKALQKSLAPLLKDGDLVLSFRAEWAGGGAYTSVQMGVSHAGLIYTDAGQVANVDSPLNEEYVGKLDSKHYKETQLLHVIRPRDLSGAQKKNLAGWAKLFASKRSTIYPAKIAFNKDYSAPSFNPNATEPLSFVKDIGAHALGLPGKAQSVYCSEFAWAVLALRNCDPVKEKAAFAKAGVPSCIDPLFEPMKAVGDFAQTQSQSDDAGLTDGPLLLLQALNLETKENTGVINEAFSASENSRMSQGHRDVANEFAPMFAPLKDYYLGYNSGLAQILGLKDVFNQRMMRNYSPTSYVINTLLPENNDKRVLDYVGTIVFID
jgi:hypothetical protein